MVRSERPIKPSTLDRRHRKALAKPPQKPIKPRQISPVDKTLKNYS
jgi:hypothetical protein